MTNNIVTLCGLYGEVVEFTIAIEDVSTSVSEMWKTETSKKHVNAAMQLSNVCSN